jgi:hypothetical protein
MRLLSNPRVIAAVLTGAACAGAAMAQERGAPGQNQDGVYAIDITTKQGSCDKAYHWMIAVSGGRVRSAGEMPLEASGEITQRGIVQLAFERFGQIATARGRLSRGSGSGTWYSPTLQCRGFWQASRQG